MAPSGGEGASLSALLPGKINNKLTSVIDVEREDKVVKKCNKNKTELCEFSYFFVF